MNEGFVKCCVSLCSQAQGVGSETAFGPTFITPGLVRMMVQEQA